MGINIGAGGSTSFSKFLLLFVLFLLFYAVSSLWTMLCPYCRIDKKGWYVPNSLSSLRLLLSRLSIVDSFSHSLHSIIFNTFRSQLTVGATMKRTASSPAKGETLSPHVFRCPQIACKGCHFWKSKTPCPFLGFGNMQPTPPILIQSVIAGFWEKLV